MGKVLASMGVSFKGKDLMSVCALANESRQSSGPEYQLSTRDVVQILEDAHLLGDMSSALRVALGKFEGADRDWFVVRVESTFGYKLR